MQKMLGILVGEDTYGGVQRAVHLAVDLLHHHERHILVGYALDQGVLHHVRERRMSQVVQQDSNHGAVGFLVGDGYTFLPQRSYRIAHQVHCAYRVQKAAVLCARINDIRQPKLSYAIQTLHVRVLQYVVNDVIGYGNKSKYRIVDDLSFVRHKTSFI